MIEVSPTVIWGIPGAEIEIVGASGRFIVGTEGVESGKFIVGTCGLDSGRLVVGTGG